MFSDHLRNEEKDLTELTSLLNEIDICGDFYDRIVTSRSELRNDVNISKESFISIVEEPIDFESFQQFDDFIKSDNFWDDFLLLGLTEEREVETETDDYDQNISESKFVDTVKVNNIILFEEKSEAKDLTFLLDVFDEFGDLFDSTNVQPCQVNKDNNTEQLVNMNQISLFINSKLFWSEILKLQSDLNEVKNDDKYVVNDPMTTIVISCKCGCIDSSKCKLINQFGILNKLNSVDSKQNEIVQPINKNEGFLYTSTAIDNSSEDSSIIPKLTSSIILDFDVIRMKSVEIITLDEFQKSSENKNISNNFIHISNEIEVLSKTGISKKILFPLFIISFACILMVIKIKSDSYTNSPMLLPVIWTIAFIFNVVAVSIPGRLDRMYSEGCHIKPWQSLFEPSSWTFAIWGVIYFAELAITMYIGWIHLRNINVLKNVELFRPVLPYWTAGNCFQALWCFVFRPEFKSKLWIPSSCLFLSALSLFGAYQEVYQIQKNIVFTNSSVYSSNFVYITKSIVSIHTTWLFCSALIVFNSWTSLNGIVKYSKGVSITFAFLSTFLVAIFGAYFTITNSDICFALTCAWALDGFASRSMEKFKLAQKEINISSDMEIKKHTLSPDIYETLSLMETILSGGLKCLALGTFIASVSNNQI